jgi:hypothetical protein
MERCNPPPYPHGPHLLGYKANRTIGLLGYASAPQIVCHRSNVISAPAAVPLLVDFTKGACSCLRH